MSDNSIRRASPQPARDLLATRGAAHSRRKTSSFFAGLLGFMLGAGTLSVLAASAGVVSEAPKPEATGVVPTSDPVDLRNGFTAVAEAVVLGVVRIETTRTERYAQRPPRAVPPGFERFFGAPETSPPRMSVSGGTGFVVSEDGYILTNHHVVDDADDITVWLHDRRSFPAEFVGSDPTTDVAVLRIDGDDLPVLPLGDSDLVRVGEWSVAVGNPGFRGGIPLDETVTVGIVSAVDRPLSVIRSELSQDPDESQMAEWAIENFIQTDAVINPGNSGGPLVNLHGEVVGMNSAIASSSGSQGYGFAIPINLVRGVFDDLVEHGRVDERGSESVSVMSSQRMLKPSGSTKSRASSSKV